MVTETSQFDDSTRSRRLLTSDKPLTAGVTGPLDLERPWVIELRVPGTLFTLQARIGDSMVIGRADHASGFTPEVDLSPFDALINGVSRKHAAIAIRNQRLMIADLNSVNGTRLNDVICKPGEAYRLRHGSEVMFGKLRLQVSFAVVPVLTDTQNARPQNKKFIASTLSGDDRRVLVVEDDNAVGNVYRMALEYVGYKVTLVTDATKALGFVCQKMPDVIILDLMLPGMSGLDFVRYIRQQKTPQHIPILVVSGASGGFQMNQVMSAGADAFLGKPVAVEELLQTVENAKKVNFA
jgi:CheY-like chemotaxis protein